MSKKINVRTQHKIDTYENWSKAENFVPLKGELIIYTTDENGNEIVKLKIGDGETKVNDLPFAVGGSATDEPGLAQIQSDWAQTDSTQPDYIKNKPIYNIIVNQETGKVEQSLDEIVAAAQSGMVLVCAGTLSLITDNVMENGSYTMIQLTMFALPNTILPVNIYADGTIEMELSDNMQMKSERVLSISEESTDMQYPTAKAVVDFMNTSKQVISNKYHAGTETWYFPLGQMVVDDSGNYGNFTFTGRLGGWTNANTAVYSIMLMNRGDYTGNIITATVSVSGQYDAAIPLTDIVVAKNDDKSHTVYLKCTGYFCYDFAWTAYQHSIIYDGSYSTTTPSNILWTLSAAPKTILSSDGSFSATGGINVEISNVNNLQTTLNNKQGIDSRVTSITSTSTNEQYPTAKAVYDIIGDIDTAISQLEAMIGGASS